MSIDEPAARAESPGGAAPDRRAVLLLAATAAAVTATGTPCALAQDVPAEDYGAPIVELCVPAGVLTLEQKGAMVRGITDVMLRAMKRSADPERRIFVAITETAEGGFGVDGQVYAPRRKSS